MADNIDITPGTGKTVSTDEISIDGATAHVQRVKPVLGAAGSGVDADSNSGNKSAGTQRVVLATDQPQLTNALKVDGSASTQPVSASSLPLPTGAATEAKQDTGNTALDNVNINLGSIDGKITAANTDSVTVTSNVAPSDLVTPGTITAINEHVDLVGLNGASSVSVLVTGTYTGALTPQVSVDNTTWTTITNAVVDVSTGAVSSTILSGAQSTYLINIPSVYAFRVKALGAVTGTAEVTIRGGQGANAGPPLDTNSGNKSGGTQRVVLATDQPQLTAKLLVTPDSVALPANQSVNNAQVAGTTTDTNSGTKSAGTQRVVLATDQPALTNALKVDASATTQPVSGTFWQATQPVSGTVTANAGSGTLSVDTELPAAAAVSDALVNPTAPAVASFPLIFGGTTWFRWYAASGVTDGSTAPPIVHNMTFNGTNHDKMRSIVNATNSTGTGITAVGNLAQFDDVSPTSITENQFGNLRMSANRNLYGTVRDAAGNERGANVSAGNALLVDASATTQPVSMATNQPVGTVAHDGVDSGNPVKTGAKANSALSTATMVASGDRTDNVSDLDGAQIVRLNFPLGDLLSERTTNTDGASTASGVFTATASTRSVITAISVYNSSATAGFIDFRDGTAGSVLWTMALPAGGGAVLSDPTGMFRTTANTALAYDVSAALSTVYISVSGFKTKV